MALVDFKAATSALLERFNLGRKLGMTFGTKRDVYGVLGYKDYGSITTQDCVERYERGGIAGRIVDVLPNATWRGEMWVEEDEDPEKVTDFEQAWLDLDKRLNVRERLLRVDKLSRLSSYAVLLIGAPGELDTELPKGNGKADKILYVQPFLGGSNNNNSGGANRMPQVSTYDADAVIAEFDADASSPRFGLPKTYNLKRTDVSSPMLQKPVHWTRIVHVAEGTLRDDVYGLPALERVWNDLDNLEKVVGGGSEAFWIRCNQGLHLNVDKDMTIATTTGQTELDKLAEQAELYQHQLSRTIRTRGVEVNALGSDVANFANPADTILMLIAGATGIPKRLLVGSEMGELASTQDRENFRDLINGRQTNYAGPSIVRPLVDRLIEYNYLPTPSDYKVQWPHIEVLGEKEKVEGAKGWAAVNQTQGDVVFTSEEIRDHWAGMAPLTDEQKAEIEAANAKKVADAQAAMVAQQPDQNADPNADPTLKAAEADEEIVKVLAAAIECGAMEVVDVIVGTERVLGDLPGHEFHGNQWTSAEGSYIGQPHGTVVAKSKLGQVEVVRGHSTPGKFDNQGDTRFISRKKNGEAVGTRSTLREAKELLRKPSNAQSFVSGYLSPDVAWKYKAPDA